MRTCVCLLLNQGAVTFAHEFFGGQRPFYYIECVTRLPIAECSVLSTAINVKSNMAIKHCCQRNAGYFCTLGLFYVAQSFSDTLRPIGFICKAGI